MTKAFEDKLWARIKKTETCWLWVGAKSHGGYGSFRHEGSKASTGAHRVVWTALRGPIPEGHEIDHLCRVVACVNPDHLEPVTPQENKRRAGAAIKFCKQGHEYAPENTYYRKNGTRACLECNRIYRLAHPKPSRATGLPKALKAFCRAGHRFPETPKLNNHGNRVCEPCAARRAEVENARKRQRRVAAKSRADA